MGIIGYIKRLQDCGWNCREAYVTCQMILKERGLNEVARYVTEQEKANSEIKEYVMD